MVLFTLNSSLHISDIIRFFSSHSVTAMTISLDSAEASFNTDFLVPFPKITEMSDNLPCEDAILSFLPYGCAGYIYTDDDKNIGADYKNKYETERNKVIRADYTEI